MSLSERVFTFFTFFSAVWLLLSELILSSINGQRLLVVVLGIEALDEFHCLTAENNVKIRVLLWSLHSFISLSAFHGFFPALVCFGLSQFLFLGTSILRTVRQGKFSKAIFSEICVQGFGLWYVSFNISHGVLLCLLEDGVFILWYVLACTEIGVDTGALLIGKAFGRHKPCAAISPNKSTEGFLGGILGGVLFSILFRDIVFPYFNVRHPLRDNDFILLGLLNGVQGIIGDLFESLLKRCVDVKDTRAVLPGMGGILDRLDALLFTFPTTYYYFYYCLYFRN